MSNAISFLPPFISLRPTARWATGLLIATVILAWIAVGVNLAELRLLLSAAGGTRIAIDTREAQLLTGSILVGTQILLLMATGVAFLLWLFQARVNVRALGVRRLRYPRGWVVGSFLVPILNLFRPYQVIREVWQASDPGNLDPFNWRRLPVPRLLPLWWSLFVAYGTLQAMALLAEGGASMSLARMQLSATLTILADVAAATSAFLGCLVVGRISDAQQEKWASQSEQEAAGGEGATTSPA